jgi:geranylgeranyl reductase family protein
MTQLPSQCDVLVVGAGPAGSACSIELVRNGFDVLLVDQHEFPRDKICGDGLIPDAHAALRRLGVYDEVAAAAHRVAHVACIAPLGGRIDVPGSLAVLPRRELDDILCRAAQRTGARFAAPVRFDAPLTDDSGRVVGARLKSGGALHEVRAQWVVLATGAPVQAMQAAGLCDRQAPSAVALRGYVKNDAMAARITEMEVVWHRKLRPGYGWIFPVGNGVFNIGVGAFHKERNLREMFAAFGKAYAPARELMAGGTLLGPLKGAPLRCSLNGARSARPGLLATGETVGSTYAFTGEGIGKAMETALLAAEALIEARRGKLTDAEVQQRYDAQLDKLRPRFVLYEKANAFNRWPWLVDLVVWRGQRDPVARDRMARVLEEKSIPGSILTVKGMFKLLGLVRPKAGRVG